MPEFAQELSIPLTEADTITNALVPIFDDQSSFISSSNDEQLSREEVDPQTPQTFDLIDTKTCCGDNGLLAEASDLPHSANGLYFGEAIVSNVDLRYPANSLQKYGEDRWMKEKPNSDTYIRNQSRPENKKLELNDLKSLLPASKGETRYWFHATGWQSAEQKRQSGPIMSEGKLDLAVGQAFYLNPNYDDCYEWLFTKNSVYRGQHAILIYRFDLADLGRQGKELGLAEWKSVARRWSTVDCPDDWTYTFQNSDPKNVDDPKRRVKPRQMSNGKVAMQLILRTKELCSQIHKCLVGCIFFENLHATTIAKTPAKPACLKQTGSSKSKKRHRNR